MSNGQSESLDVSIMHLDVDDLYITYEKLDSPYEISSQLSLNCIQKCQNILFKKIH